MDSYKAVLYPIARWTRLRMSHGPDELLRVIVPPPAQVRHETTAPILEGLSLWLDAQLAVVLSVDARSAGCCLGLTRELGAGDRSVFHRVEAAGRDRRRRRGACIPGVGDLAGLRQLRSGRAPRSTIRC